MSELESDGKFQISTLGKTRNFGVTKMIDWLAGFYLFIIFNTGENNCVWNRESME